VLVSIEHIVICQLTDESAVGVYDRGEMRVFRSDGPLLRVERPIVWLCLLYATRAYRALC
jgi:hypothetical protein